MDLLWIAAQVALLLSLAWCLYVHLQRVAAVLGMKHPRLMAAGVALLFMLPVYNLWRAFDWVVLVLHFCVFCLVADAVAALVRRLHRSRAAGRGSRVWKALHTFMVFPLFCTAVVALCSYADLQKGCATHYTVTTAKPIRAEGYRIALVADIHYGLLVTDP